MPIAPPTSVEGQIKLYSYYRNGELHGSNLIFKLLRMLPDDPQAQILLTEHLADETRHAWLWTQLIRELGGAPVQVEDGYQARLRKRVGIPRSVVDLFAISVVVEKRALKRYAEHLKYPDIHQKVREVLQKVTYDEGWHVDWMRKKGRELSEESDNPNHFDEKYEAYSKIDEEVWQELESKEIAW